jgi:outer membrane immunogenic protein
MRRLFVALALIGFASAAGAADYELSDPPILRGSNPVVQTPYVPAPPTFTRWSGFYAGGQVSHGTGNFNFADATSSLVAFILRNSTAEDVLRASEWTTLPKRSVTANGIGAFVGYNTQWDDAILGIEFNYTHMPFRASATDFIHRFRDLNNVRYDVAIASNASLHILDYATFRGRAGYAVGQFLPYATLGLAIGRANTVHSASVTELEFDVTPPAIPPFTQIGGLGTVAQTDVRTGVFTYGYSTSLGLDFLVMPNVFARGEVEYVYFPNTQGIKAALTTGRVGMGMKF